MNPASRIPSGAAASSPARGSAAKAATAATGQGIPEATVARLPVYLRALHGLSARGVATVSSEELASATGVNSAKLRKDLSHLGSYGTRGVGYDVEYLVYQISRELGLTQDWSVAIVGVGNLGRALAHYGGFASRGFRVAALLDADPAIVGERVAALPVEPVDELERVVEKRAISIAVIATPAGSAQSVCDRVADAGVTSVLNFAPVVLSVPPGVQVRKVDLSIELQILAFHEQRKESLEAEQLVAMRSTAADAAPVPNGRARAHAGRSGGRARTRAQPANTERRTDERAGVVGERSEPPTERARTRARPANTGAVEA